MAGKLAGTAIPSNWRELLRQIETPTTGVVLCEALGATASQLWYWRVNNAEIDAIIWPMLKRGGPMHKANKAKQPRTSLDDSRVLPLLEKENIERDARMAIQDVLSMNTANITLRLDEVRRMAAIIALQYDLLIEYRATIAQLRTEAHDTRVALHNALTRTTPKNHANGSGYEAS